MTTTPNYSWPLIENTDFVTNLPADLETLADAIDDTVKDLNPGTTAGDVDYYTSGTAKARLGIGTAGQVLTVNSGATAPEWKTPVTGGATLLASGTLSGSAVNLTGISQGYRDLLLVINSYRPATDNQYIRIRFENDSNLRYDTPTAFTGNNVTPTNTSIDTPNSDNGTSNSYIRLELYDYSVTNKWHLGNFVAITNNATTPATNYEYRQGMVIYRNTGAIDEINLVSNSGNFTSGDYFLYGVN